MAISTHIISSIHLGPTKSKIFTGPLRKVHKTYIENTLYLPPLKCDHLDF